MRLTMSDRIVDNVVLKILDRSEKGVIKYGTTLERTDIDLLGWIVHAQEEVMDMLLYLERIKHELQNQTHKGKSTEVIASDVQELRRSAECPSSLYASSDEAYENVGRKEHSPTNRNSEVYGAFDPLC